MINSISEITQLWDKALNKISERLNDPTTFESFFSNSYIYEINDNKLVVIASSNLAKTLMNTKFRDDIYDAVSDLTESDFEIEFQDKDWVEEQKAKYAPKPKTEANYFSNAKINTTLTFDNFVVGQFNREASQASVLIARNPGKMFNPLFIHSDSGLGKTHLLHAIGNAIIKEGNPKAKILYITANDFVEEYIKYVRADKDSESLKDFFKGIDVLLFDDVQFLADKIKTEEMFFYIYSRMISDGKQIVITSDKQPTELRSLEDRLVTRFSQGLVVKINNPDNETCVQILEKKIEANGLDINAFDPGILEFFADKFSSNVRELEGALNRLIFYTVNLHHSDHITMDVAVEAVESMVGGKQIASQLNEHKIINVVADYYNLTPNQLTGKIRTGQIALARHIAMYLIREVLDLPFKKIGASFGGKDHTTVMSGVERVEKGLKTDDALRAAVEELKRRVKS